MSRLNAAVAHLEATPAVAEAELARISRDEPSNLEAKLALATVQLKLLKVSEAAITLKAALAVNAGFRPAQLLLATTLTQLKDDVGALSLWKTIAASNPGSVEAREHIIALAERLGDQDSGLAARRELAQLLPGNPEVVADLAVALSRAEKHREAVSVFDRANTLEPGFVEKHQVERQAYAHSKAARR